MRFLPFFLALPPWLSSVEEGEKCCSSSLGGGRVSNPDVISRPAAGTRGQAMQGFDGITGVAAHRGRGAEQGQLEGWLRCVLIAVNAMSSTPLNVRALAAWQVLLQVHWTDMLADMRQHFFRCIITAKFRRCLVG